MMRTLLLGNEAVALGARDAHIRVLSAYPGTPSTEIAQTLAGYGDVYAEWAANEKVAAEVAIGASVAGARAMCAMKHVGLNVAADALFTAAYTGVNAGLVFVVADDPGMHSSQNEQDTHMIAAAAHVPVLEPADSQQAYDFMRLAVELSETMDLPVILRLTTRVAHSRGFVDARERAQVDLKPYEKDVAKYVMMPSNAIGRKADLVKRFGALRDYAETADVNRIERADGKIGVLCAGICVQYVKEALPDADIFQLGLVHPLPGKMIRAFAQSVETLIVVEELEPFIEQQVKAMGIECVGIGGERVVGELSAARIRRAVLGEAITDAAPEGGLPPRPPVLCAGCPHRASFHVLKKLRATVFGDIGCYTLGALPPLSSMDTTVCMGASIGMAHGAELARGRDFARRSLAVIGDSTFFHSGMTGLASAVYNGANITVLILDNAITGMTGHQHHPSTGQTLLGQAVAPLSIEDVCRALGAASVAVVDPVNVRALEGAITNAWGEDGVSVVIARRPCALLKQPTTTFAVDAQVCTGCSLCLQTGCPALRRDGKVAAIDPEMCRGCALCAAICPKGCIGVRG